MTINQSKYHHYGHHTSPSALRVLQSLLQLRYGQARLLLLARSLKIQQPIQISTNRLALHEYYIRNTQELRTGLLP